jgi:septal ring factor EnvC (AmiA/AmiB activator)
MWEFIRYAFDFLTGTLRGDLLALRELINQNQEALTKQMSDVNQVLTDTRLKLEQNNAVIAEIAGDVQELKTSNETLAAKVAELQAQIPNNPLVQEIAALVGGQGDTLSTIAAVVPEPPPPTPEPVP